MHDREELRWEPSQAEFKLPEQEAGWFFLQYLPNGNIFKHVGYQSNTSEICGI